MSVRRIALVVVVATALGAGGLVDRWRDDPAVVDVDTSAEALPATRAGGPAVTWYCPTLRAPEVDDLGIAVEGSLVLANPSPEEASARLTVMSDSGAPVDRRVTVPPRDHLILTAAELSDDGLVGAVVETDATRLAVTRTMLGVDGDDNAPCASTVGRTWFTAAGSTRRDADLALVLFNPFPDDAVVDVEVATEAESGPFRSTALEGIVVPGGRPTVVVLTDIARRRDQVSMLIETRAGRVVVDRLQSYDGSLDRQGLSVAVGLAGTATDWALQTGPRLPGERERLVLYNPGDETAEVEVVVQPADETFVEPWERSVARRSFVVLELDELDRGVPPGVGHGIIVSSLNEVPVTAEVERWGARGPEPAPTLAGEEVEEPEEGDPADELTYVPGPVGSDAWPGTPVVADRWLVPYVVLADPAVTDDGGLVADEVAPRVVIENPAAEPVTAEVRWFGGGRVVEVTEQEVGSASALSVDLRRISVDAAGLVVEASGPVAVAAGSGPGSWAPALRIDDAPPAR